MSASGRDRVAWGILLFAGLAACGGGPARVETVSPSREMVARPAPPTQVRGRILAARAQPSDGVDRLLVIFDRPVDPSTVVPRAFRVVTRAGGWAVPERAYLDPADLGRAGFVVVLEGDFGIGTDGPPWSVTIVGRLAAQDGVSFAGQGGEVLPPDAPVRIRLAACAHPPVAASCDGTALVVVADGPVEVDATKRTEDEQGRDAADATDDAGVRWPHGASDRSASPVAVVCRAPDGAWPVLRDGRGRPVDATVAASSQCGMQRTPIARGAPRSR